MLLRELQQMREQLQLQQQQILQLQQQRPGPQAQAQMVAQPLVAQAPMVAQAPPMVAQAGDAVQAQAQAQAQMVAQPLVAQAPNGDADADADAYGDAVQQQSPAQRWREVQVFALRCVFVKLPVRHAVRRGTPRLWPALKTAFDRVVDHLIKSASELQWSDKADIASVGPTRAWSINKYYAKAYNTLNGLARNGSDMVPEAVLITKLQLTEQDAANVRLVTEAAFLELGRDDDPDVRLDWLGIWTN